jgi:sec-independent protein translocase protein TatA
MFGDALQPWHLLVLAIVAFLLFGAKRLPELGKGLGEGLKGFKEGLKGINEPTAPAPTVQQNAAPAPPVSAPAEPQIVRKD